MSVGKMSEFNIHKDNWRLYVDRLEEYFIVNKVTDELQVSTLITLMGAECYELLVDLCTPVKPKEKTFKQIVDTLEKHLQPKPSILAERYKFRHRTQKDNESISEYIAVLKKMSKTCEFGSWLEESLRDQLVCGLRSETIRQRLFAESVLAYTRAYSLAISMEAAEKDAALVEGHGRSTSDAPTTECQAITGERWRPRRGGAATAAGTRDVGRVGQTVGSRSSRGNRSQAPPTTTPTERGGQARNFQPCRACGGSHASSTCKFSRYVCRVCNREGHLRRMCPNVTDQHYAGEGEGSDSEDSEEVICIDFNQLTLGQCKPIMISVNIQNKTVAMECDTGSAVSCISFELYKQWFSSLQMKKSKLALRYYTGEVVHPIGVVKPRVSYKDTTKELDLYVMENAKNSLLGRQWIAELDVQLPKFDYDSVNALNVNEEFNLEEFSSRYCEVFAAGLGRCTGPPVSVHVRQGARPVFLRARPLPYALREPVERTLREHVRDGILTPVDRSDWATPIVPVVKKDGNIRICADFKLTLNKVLEIDRYPLPRVEDLLVRLHGGQRFSKIDLSQAYAQLVLDDSKKYTVINTHKGLFRYNRLVYGLASSPGIFQRRLEELFSDLPLVGVFLDDVIITGKSSKEHVENLHKVFQRLERNGLRVKKEKCEFFAESISYLGHVISTNGVHTCPNKIKAIRDTPAPSNVSELRSFIGMIMYYSKFIQNVSTILAPLYELLKVGSSFKWDERCQNAFEVVKGKLTSSEVLVHYDGKAPVVLTADASSVGVGAVLSQLTADGERPVAYASRALSPAERHYSQIDREALAITYGIRKFHQFLYGRKFTLRTDHKPLTYIFGDKVGIPVMAASRLQRWAVLLSGYSYDIQYVTSKKNCADALSRLPPARKVEPKARVEVTYVNFVEKFLPITNSEVRQATAKDTHLSRVKMYVESGWPAACPNDEIKPFFNRQNELYVESGCIMWGHRMIIPSSLRQLVLKQLHSSHMGIVKTKCWARSYVWWPQIDQNVETMCRECETCALEAAAPPKAAPQAWFYHEQPWVRLHVDFLTPYRGSTFLVLVDSSSKWLEVQEMKTTCAASVIKVLRAIFARFGLPVEIVSDQGPPFTSLEYSNFLKNNGIKQTLTPAYHPSSNGAAENAVKLCKRAIKKAFRDNVDIDAAIQTFLLTYRNTIHSTTGETPAMILQKRSLRTRLDLLRGGRAIEERVRTAQDNQTRYAGGSQRDFVQGETVWARGFGKQDKWVKGTVQNKEGSRRYSILDSGNGQLLKRHVDQVRRRSRLSDVTCPDDAEPREAATSSHRDTEDVVPPAAVETVVDGSGSYGQVDERLSHSDHGESVVSTPLSPHAPQLPIASQYPKRDRKPVQRYGFEFD